MSKPARNKQARSKPAKTSSNRNVQPDDEIIKSSIMKYAEEMFDFDEQGNVIKRKVDGRGMKIEEEDPEINPESIKEKEQKKVKLQKQKKRIVNSNTGISFGDLLNDD